MGTVPDPAVITRTIVSSLCVVAVSIYVAVVGGVGRTLVNVCGEYILIDITNDTLDMYSS